MLGWGKFWEGLLWNVMNRTLAQEGLQLWGAESTERRDQGERPEIKEQGAVGLQHWGQTHEEIWPTWDCSWCCLVNIAGGRNVQAQRKIPVHARASPHSLPPSGIRAFLMLLILPILLGIFFSILILVGCTSPARCSIPATHTSLPVPHPCHPLPLSHCHIPALLQSQTHFPTSAPVFVLPLFFNNLSLHLLPPPPPSEL